jgi:DNA-binding SARP family transcriptional activator
MFRLKLFGGAVIEGPAGILRGRLVQRRRLALLACLAVAHGRSVSRDKLMALLWPETELERARHHLSDSLYLIRKELGEASVVSAGVDLTLAESIVSSDIAEFEDALLRGQLEQAAALYGGPFLDGFHIDDSPEFEHWLDAERERLARSRARLLEMLADERESARDFAGAAEWWRHLAAHEPASGRVASRAMLALDAAGDRAGAIQHGRTHALVLHEHFGIAADADVVALTERLRADGIPRTLGGTAAPRAPAPEPTHRITTEPPAPDLTAAGEIPGVPESPPRLAATRSRLTRRALPIGMLVLIAAVAAGAWLVTRPGGHDVIVVADAARDTLLGDFVAERLRQVLAQSPRMSVMGRPAIDEVLLRMGRTPQARLVPDLAREVALREGLKAFVRLDVLASGEGRYLSAALVSAERGELLDSEGAIAMNATEVVAATDRLAHAVQRRFPARLGATAGRARLYPVTTDSLRALLTHMEGFLAYRLRGDVRQAIEIAEQAIAIDTAFAQAYLHLHLFLNAQGSYDRRSYNALLAAYRFRERLSPYERDLVEAEYYVTIENDFYRAIDRYRGHIREAKKFGRNQVVVGYLPLAALHVGMGDLDAAERVLQESREWFPGPFNQALLVRVLFTLEKDAEAQTVLNEATQKFPGNSWPRVARAHWAAAAGDNREAHRLALGIDAAPDLRFGLRTAALFDAVEGRFDEASTHLQDLGTQLREAGLLGAAFGAAAAVARLQLIAGDTLGAVRHVEEFLAGLPMDSVGAWGQPALLMARFFAQANRPERAAEYLDAYQRSLPPALARHDPWQLRQARAALALANRDPERALAELRAGMPYQPRNDWFEDPLLPLDNRPELARAFAQAGRADSAIAVYERYLGSRALFRAELDAFELGPAYERLAMLYEERGELARAAEYHRKLARLWRSADGPLQHRATAAIRRAIAVEGRPQQRIARFRR